ncbi:unnamed protein product, partial [Laminaria digitata]
MTRNTSAVAARSPYGEQVAQIIHISDLHVAVPSWTTGHQPEILKTLEHSIEDYLLDQAWTLFGWSPDRTRLVVTGDLTAIGDDESLETALDSIDDIATTAGITPWVIHGNHDVWSGS